MSLSKYFKRADRLDGLIRRKSTGSPRELAAKLNLSERSLYELINQMKELGAPITYCQPKKSYVYDIPVKFSFGFKKIVN